MGIWSHLFVADPANAIRYENEAALAQELPSWVLGRVQLSELTDLQYEVLWAALDGRPWGIDSHSLEELSMRKDGGSWLYRFPPSFVVRLAETDAGSLGRVAEQWVQSGELHGATPAETLPVLHELTQLARLAQSDGKGLFLWGSL
jgi:hypothetical protein